METACLLGRANLESYVHPSKSEREAVCPILIFFILNRKEFKMARKKAAEVQPVLSYKEAISFEALDDSLMKCKNGVMWKQTPLSFYLNEFRKVYNLCQSLKKGTYEPYEARRFPIFYPKFREILSIHFRDRVFQRSLNDNILYPTMVKTFTKSNCACQKGKGTDFALDALLHYLRHHFRKYGMKGTVVQFDVHGYYKHMKSSLPKRIFESKIKEKEASEVIGKTLECQHSPVDGFLPGSQMVQIAGISALSPLDHYIAEKLEAELSLRYMDDLLLIFLEEDDARKGMDKVLSKLQSYGFTPNPNKTKMYSLKKGIKFLGFHFKLTATGKVKQHVLSKNVGHRVRMINALSKKVKEGVMTIRQFEDSFISWAGHVQRSPNSHNLLLKMKKKLLKAKSKLIKQTAPLC